MASDYRPISLCNVVYKIMSKVLANRLKKLLNNVVSPNQSAFILGRLITNNIMVAYEVLHSMKARKKGKVESMAIKLDMSKAYDRIEWVYLEVVMGKLRFCRKWIDLIMRSVSILVLNQSDRNGCTRGVTLARNGTRVNHLLFADDCILFGRAKAEEWGKIQELLLKYEKASGQFLNKEKTAVFFNTNSRTEEKKKIMELGGNVMRGSYEKYLGLPPVVGKPNWEKLGRPKGRGGLGFRDLESFNLALLAKQAWRFLQNPRSMVAKIFKEKYYRSGSLLETKLGHRPSYIWRNVWGALKLLKEGLRWRVGNGKSIKIWEHKWLPTPSSHCVQAPISVMNARARVSELISNGEWDVQLIKNIFRQEEVEQICSIPISKSNAEDRLIWGCTTTSLFSIRSAYQLDMSRNEAVKGENSERREEDKRWQSIWDLNIQGKVKLFMWRAVKDLLATRSNLVMRRIIDNSKCPNCKVEEETVSHTLWSCPAAADVWAESLKVTQKWKSKETDLDEEGEILVAAGEQMNYMIDAAIVESFALRKAMEVCHDLNFNNVWFEGDAQNIENAVNAETKDMSRYGSVIEDVKNMLKGREKWSVSFVFREANEATHVLAKEALFFQSKIVWIEDAPDCIRSIIVKEKSCSENIVQ
ncbi:uncharacterized protein LOC122306274 [Carya illinoinensis]|uniref:uncharacterized protein LOC122306274 n=1 Tax=Carya illinoinensis TaxID=32201 RepID=UPI001C7278B7|nr:uncharacterized protein LOC122306274 [Carya illinoinensis]